MQSWEKFIWICRKKWGDKIVNGSQLYHWLFHLQITELVALNVTFKSSDCHHRGKWQFHQYLLTWWRAFLSSKAGRKIQALSQSWPCYSDFWLWAPLNPQGIYPFWMNTAFWGLMVQFDLRSELGHNAVVQPHCCLLLNVLGGIMRYEISRIWNHVLLCWVLWKQLDHLSAIRPNINGLEKIPEQCDDCQTPVSKSRGKGRTSKRVLSRRCRSSNWTRLWRNPQLALNSENVSQHLSVHCCFFQL